MLTYIAGYRFTPLIALAEIRQALLRNCQENQLKGTILLSSEGININLAGNAAAIIAFKNELATMPACANICFNESAIDTIPFRTLKIKIKPEIITMRQQEVIPAQATAARITPLELKKWLDEKKEMLLLDTRNQYEIETGTFTNAVHLNLSHFNEFPAKSTALPQDKPIVMFCTGGIRCEKAALYLMQQGFPEVYQLDGGILNYFTKVGDEHYHGNCFVFDEREKVEPCGIQIGKL